MEGKQMFGTQKTTNLLDDDGSRVTVEENIVAGKVNRPVRKYYEIKTRVHSQKDEHAAYLSFSDEIQHDKSLLDPSWRIENSSLGKEKGFYYVIKCYTQLEY